MDDSEDSALVAAFLRSRSEEAFLRLYHRHTYALYRFAARLSGGPGFEPAEIVQDAWVRAIERLDRFRWRSSLRTWLCGIVLNRWREMGRRSREVRRDLRAIDLPPSAPGPDPEIVRIAALIEELPAGYREILVLHDVEGFTHAEIARDFGISEGTSKSQLHRARRTLRELLRSGGERNHG